MTAQTAADLRAAADVLERDGWAQGGLHPSGLCAIEAVWRVCGVGPRADDAIEALRPATPAPHSIIDWNDEPGLTASEVIATLRAAAAGAEAGQ